MNAIYLAAASMLVLGLAATYVVYYLFEKKKESKLGKLKTIYVKANEEAGILFELLGTNLTHTISLDATVCKEFFLSELLNKLGVTNMQIVRSITAAGESMDIFNQDRELYKLVGKDGVMLLSVAGSSWNIETTSGVGYDISSYASDGKVQILESAWLVVPTVNCDETCQLDMLDAIRTTQKATEVKRVYAEAKAPTSKMYTLGKRGDMYVLRETSFNYRDLPDVEVDLCYEPSTVFLDKQYDRVPMSEVLAIQTDMLKNGKNVFVLGPAGVGKTTLCGSVWAKLVDAGYMIVKLDYDSIDGPQSAVQTALEEQITPYLVDGVYKGVVYVVDEARALFNEQRHSDVLLDLMDGIRKREDFPMSVMISINAEAKELDPTLFRAGRTHMAVSLTYLSGQRAHALVKHIRQTRPDLMFNQPILEDLLKNGKKIENTVIHPAGVISSADIWNTVFRPVEDHEKYATRLKPYAVKEQPGPSASQPKSAQPTQARAKVVL